MRFTLFSLVGLALALGVAAQDAPAWVEPSGGFGGTVGGDCNLNWDRDSTGDWTNVQIDLMTGPDHLKRAIYRVATGVDMTNSDDWTHDCPDVDTSAEIYFYRMTRLDTTDYETSRKYTQRFCIVQSGENCDTPALGYGRGYITGSKMSQYHQSTNSIWD